MNSKLLAEKNLLECLYLKKRRKNVGDVRNTEKEMQ